MRLCLECGHGFASQTWVCPRCGNEPVFRNGIRILAPDEEFDGAGWDPADFELLASLETGNFWFEARNRLITWALGAYFPEARRYLEVGCGTGFVLAGIHRAFPHLDLTGTELHSEGLSFAQERAPDAHLAQMDGRSIPFRDEFDLVGIFDVLEHIREDERVLSEIHAAISPGGGVMITVPQHPWLWSPADEAAQHCRRYRRKDLLAKVRAAGFEVERVTSFVSILLPLMAASRIRRRYTEFDVVSEYRIGDGTGAALLRALALERGLIKRGLSPRAGGSILLIGRRT